jgi:hypothetical protein
MSTLRRALLAPALALAAFIAPRDAAACYDGWVAKVGDVSLVRAMAVGQWTPDHARHAARWGTRLDELLPAGAELEVTNTEAFCSGACGSVSTIAAGTDDLPKLFREAARAFHVPPKRVRAAASAEAETFTVQLFAGSARGASAMKKRVVDAEAGEHGFFDEGGFPASNDPAHVIRDARGVHRTIVGVFLSREAAEDARAALIAKGFRGFVRELPAGTAVNERSYTLLG